MATRMIGRGAKMLTEGKMKTNVKQYPDDGKRPLSPPAPASVNSLSMTNKDILVIAYEQALSEDELDGLNEKLNQVLNGMKVMVIDGGARVQVIKGKNGFKGRIKARSPVK